MALLELAPDETGQHVLVTTDTAGEVEHLDLGEEGKELVRLGGDVPLWLDGVCAKLFS